MKYKRVDRLVQEVDILNNRTISVDYLSNIFNVRRQSILNDLYILKNKGYDVKKVDIGYYTLKPNLVPLKIKELFI